MSVVPAALVCVRGAIIVRKSPNPIGWTVLGAGAFFALDGIAGSHAFADHRLHAGTLPLGGPAVRTQPPWAPALVLIAVSHLIVPGERRIQQQWLASGALVCPLAGLALATQRGSTSHRSAAVGGAATALLAALPISIGIAIFELRLDDVDRGSAARRRTPSCSAARAWARSSPRPRGARR